MGRISVVFLLCFSIRLFTQAVASGKDASPAGSGPIVTTKAGSFQGLKLKPPGLGNTPVCAFLGIPYAEPPTGPLRFRKPKPINFIPGIFKATEKPPSCLQIVSNPPFPWQAANTSLREDCLYLNIWTPERLLACQKLKPVMVWIYGGGYFSGSAAMDLYDGQVIAALGDVVVVTLNYRLGALGLFSTLTDDVDSNVALYDQLQVLHWVQTNIKYFGGDPQKVTLFGESAGATSAGFLALSPLSRGLFHRMIMQSGSSYLPVSPDPNEGVETGNQLAVLVGCANQTHSLKSHPKDVVDCLRTVPAADLTKVYYRGNGSKEPVQLSFQVQFLDDVIPMRPADVFRSKNYALYDVFTGVTKDEGSLFFPELAPDIYQQILLGGMSGIVLNKSIAAEALRRFFGEVIRLPQAERIGNFYIKDIEDDDKQGLVRAMYGAFGDFVLVCPTIFSAEKYSGRGAQVRFYRFDHRPSTSTWPEWMGTAHFDEVQFVFGLPIRYPERYQKEEIHLSRHMIHTWTNFAKCRDLTLKNGQLWPAFSPGDPKFVTFQTKQQFVGTGERAAQCDFWRPYFEAE